MTQKRDPLLAIARAFLAGRGVQLSAEEVDQLVLMDDALIAGAESYMGECTCDIQRMGVQCPFCEANEEEA